MLCAGKQRVAWACTSLLHLARCRTLRPPWLMFSECVRVGQATAFPLSAGCTPESSAYSMWGLLCGSSTGRNVPGGFAHIHTPGLALFYVVSCPPPTCCSSFMFCQRYAGAGQHDYVFSVPVCICVTRNFTVWGTHVCCCLEWTLGHPHAVQSF